MAFQLQLRRGASSCTLPSSDSEDDLGLLFQGAVNHSLGSLPFEHKPGQKEDSECGSVALPSDVEEEALSHDENIFTF
jgi:hypothetical protein